MTISAEKSIISKPKNHRFHHFWIRKSPDLFRNRGFWCARRDLTKAGSRGKRAPGTFSYTAPVQVPSIEIKNTAAPVGATVFFVSSSHSGVLMLTRFLASESKILIAPLFFLQCTVFPENNSKIEPTTPVISMRQKP